MEARLMTTNSFEIKTSDRHELVVVTDEVLEAVEPLEIEEGAILVSSPHTSLATFSNEAESRLLEDMLEFVLELAPPEADYRHDELHIETNTQLNAHAHLISSLVDNPVLLPVTESEPVLGTYQDVLLLELDGPGTRTVTVTELQGP